MEKYAAIDCISAYLYEILIVLNIHDHLKTQLKSIPFVLNIHVSLKNMTEISPDQFLNIHLSLKNAAEIDDDILLLLAAVCCMHVL